MKVEIPTSCPCCGSTLQRVNDQLFCRNPDCGDVQIKKVEGYAKKMKIKGLGIKTIEKLGLRSIHDIYELTFEQISDAIGEKLASKLLAEIEKSKNTTLDVFLPACSIYLIGQTVAKKLLPFATHPSELSLTVFEKAGLGEKARNSLHEWYVNEFVGGLDALPIQFEKVELSNASTSYKYSVCITGKIPGYTKSSLAKELETYNVNTVNTVSKNIDYLLCNDRKNSSKEKKAEQLNIPIVSLDELIAFIKGEK